MLLTTAMDTPAMMRWRAVCQATKVHVSVALTQRLRGMIRQFTPHSADFLAVVTECKALIGGLFTLSFLLREPALVPTTLDVYVDEDAFSRIMDRLRMSATLSRTFVCDGVTNPSDLYRRQREIRRYASYTTDTGKHVRIHQSSTLSPCSPIIRSWTTGLMNFLTEDSFGCAYPVLTFNKRALVSSMTRSGLSFYDDIVISSLSGAGFSFASRPGEWNSVTSNPPLPPPLTTTAIDTSLPCAGFSYASRHDESAKFVSLATHIPPSTSTAQTFLCFKAQYICPDQGRFFGDPGSLLVSFAPFRANIWDASCGTTHPVSHMAIWRIWTTGRCHHNCASTDDLLPSGILSLPTLLVDNFIFRLPSLSQVPAGPLPSLAQSPFSVVHQRGRATTI